jgi:RNase P/RNase MRP subunit p29
MFEVVTKEDKLVKLPKEKSLFRVKGDGGTEWWIWGDQFLSRSGERAGRKFTGKTIRGKALLEL